MSGQHLKTVHGRSSTSVSSASSGGYSEDESLSPLPLVGRNSLKSRLQAKLSNNVARNNFANRHPLVVPKKRGLMVPSASSETDIQIKEEVIHSERTPNLNSSFKNLLVSSSPNNGSAVQPHDDFHHNRGNVIHFLNSQQKFQNPALPTTQTGSYQIKLISPPTGGTLAHSRSHGGVSTSTARGRSREDLLKMETMTPSPLQFIIAAAEQQEQAEEERVFMEGSRSEDSQHQSYQHHQAHHHSQQVGPTSSLQIHPLQEQPVNLSVKKVDLFNLTQLAEVSIAAAKREMMSSNVLSSNNVSNSATITDCPSSTLNGVSLMNAQSPLSSTNHSPAKPSQSSMSVQFPPNGVTKASTESEHNVDELVVTPVKNIDHSSSSRNGISEQKKLIKTDTTKIQAGSKESSGKIMGKLKKANSSSLLIVASEKEKLQNDKNSGAVLPSSNCTITSHNSCTSVSSSTSSSASTSSAAGASQRHRCVECGKGFSTLSNLARHRQTHRSLSDASAVKKCPHCDKVYVSMPAFSMHLRTHNQGCKCPYCGKGFSRPWLLQGHIRTHTGEKPFKCGICSKAFADKSNLRAHTQTHSTEKPFACQRCGKLLALKSYLCKHIESSCMKSNRPSGSTTNGGSGTGNGSSSVTTTTTISSTKKHHHHHHHGAINNSSSASSPVSPCSTRGTSPSLTTMIMSTLSSSSPTNRDIRSAIANATTTVTACSNNIATTSSVSNFGNNTMVSSASAARKNAVAATLSKTTNISVLGFSSHNNNNNNDEINRPSLKAANDNNNEQPSSIRNKNNCIMPTTFPSGSVRSNSNNKTFVGRSSKIRKVGDSAA